MKKILYIISVVALLVGCNKEELGRLPYGKQPVTLTATMEGQSSAQSATRATADNAWMGGEEVAVQIGSEVKKYAAATDGTLSATAPFYWTSSTEKKTVSAWTPYSDTKPTSFDVQADQSSEGYQQSDIIYATQEISYASPELEFCHLPVKVVVNLKNGEGVTADEVRSATVSIVNQNLTSGAINDADWIVAQVTPGSSTIIPNTLTTATADYQKTVQALLVPQTSTASRRLIKVAVGGQEFFYSTTLDFAAGTQHTYNITVLKSGLSVTTNGAEAWTGSETDVTSKEPATGFADKDLKIGDYYYSDNTWSDGGYRKYTDNSTAHLPVMPVLTDASGNPRTVIGIVYVVNADGTTGKIVGLDEVTRTKWSTVEAVTGATSDTDGAANTAKIFALSSYIDDNTKYPAFAWCAAKNTPATAGIKWYIPATLELKDGIYANRAILNTSLNTASKTPLSNDWYWSSTEGKNSNAWTVIFNNGFTSRDSKDYNASVRVVSAFGEKAPAVVGDFYLSSGEIVSKDATLTAEQKAACIGIVFVVNTDGKTGKIVGLDEVQKAWSTENIETSATSDTDGAGNMATILALPTYNATTYPAFAWCADKGAGWYIPAKDELLALYNAYNVDKTAFNNKLTICAGTELNADGIYWSATQSNSTSSWGVSFGYGYTTSTDKDDSGYRVRCVSVF